MERACISCLFYHDAGMNKTYATPTCTNSGNAVDAVFMRRYLCGVENPTFYEPKLEPNPEREGHAKQFKN